MEKSAYLVLVPHQDDELLTLSVPIVNAKAAAQDVYVLLISDGANASIKEKLGLSDEDFVAARDKEFINSCSKLGIDEEKILIPDNRLSDGDFDMFEAIEFISPFILDLKSSYEELTVATISPFGPAKQHPDHTTVGLAAVEIKKDKLTKFKKLELYLEPYLFEDNESYKVIAPVNTESIISSANSYRHSKYRITGQLESKRISAFLANCVAYQYNLSFAQKIKNSFKHFGERFKRLFNGLSCNRVDFDPTLLTSYNIISNRPDLYRGTFETYKVSAKGITYVCLVSFQDRRAEICTRFTSVTDDALELLCRKVFKDHKDITCIEIMQTYNTIGVSRSKKIYRLFLPNSVKVARGTYENFIVESNFITDEYALISRKKTTAAIYTSEQCDVVYVNGYTEDCPDKLFNYLIKSLNEKGKSELIIDRPLEDAIEETVYNCLVYKNYFI